MPHDLPKNLEILGLPEAIAISELRSKLRATLKETHPDATGGQFNTPGQETRFRAATEALEAISSSRGSNTQLQTIAENQVALAQTQSALTKFLDEERRQVAKKDEQRSVETSEASARATIEHSVKEIYNPIRIGGWSIAVIGLAISVLDKPLGGLIEEAFAGNTTAIHYAKISLGVISLCGVVLGLYAQQCTARKIDNQKSLMTEAGIQFLLYRYQYRIFSNGQAGVR